MAKKRNLTVLEIQDVVSYVTDSPSFVRYYTSQLQTVVINPRIIPKLKSELKEKHDKSLVQPGENVGIICAQSIGEKFTQSTLNTCSITRDSTRRQKVFLASKNS